MLTRRIIKQTSKTKLSRCIGGKYLEHMTGSLKNVDPEMWTHVNNEAHRIRDSICLIASENFTSNACMEALSTVFSNKYAEGYPGARYYGGCVNVDEVERLTQKRALEAYRLDPEEWGVNVQPLSGAPANLYTYYGVGGKDCRILAPGLPDGGHLSHGYATKARKVSATADYFRFCHYGRDPKTALYDNDEVALLANRFMPDIILAGYSAYCHHYDYAGLKEIAVKNGAYLMADMAHISGLVAGEAAPDLFEHCDIVTTTTHKSLQCARGAMIFYRKGLRQQTKKGPVYYDLESKINDSVFPAHQGGPHMHVIASIGVGLGLACTPEFKEYQRKIVENAQVMSDALVKMGYPTVGGGTINHIVLTDVKKGAKVDGARVEHLGGLVNMTVNKNVIPGGTNAIIPGGIRLGTPAMTARGCLKPEFEQISEFVGRNIKLAKQFKRKKQNLAKFKKEVNEAAAAGEPSLIEFRDEVTTFARELDYFYEDQLE